MAEPNSDRSQVMVVIAIYCNGLIGYGTQYATTGVTLCLFLPLALFTSSWFTASEPRKIGPPTICLPER